MSFFRCWYLQNNQLHWCLWDSLLRCPWTYHNFFLEAIIYADCDVVFRYSPENCAMRESLCYNADCFEDILYGLDSRFWSERDFLNGCQLSKILLKLLLLIFFMTCDGQSFLCAISCEVVLQWFDPVQAGVAKKTQWTKTTGIMKLSYPIFAENTWRAFEISQFLLKA